MLLVDPAQPEKLAQAMMRLMNDNALCKRLGSEGHVHVKEHFGVERMVDNYIGWYEKVLKTQGV